MWHCVAMHRAIRSAIIQTILNCPYEKAMIKVEQDGLEIMNPDEYRNYQQHVAHLIHAMDEDHKVTIVHRSGMVDVEEVDVDRLMEIFDPFPN